MIPFQPEATRYPGSEVSAAKTGVLLVELRQGVVSAIRRALLSLPRLAPRTTGDETAWSRSFP